MTLKITTLIENTADDKQELLFEHGLSLYIEFEGKKILFDTGQTNKFLDNAKQLGKSLEDIDCLIISHGHYDHSGGCMKLLTQLSSQTSMFVGKEFFYPKYKKLEEGKYKYNGIPFSQEDVLAEQVVLSKVEMDITYISDKIILFKNFKAQTTYEHRNEKFFIKQEEHFIQDTFNDEIALGLINPKGLVIIVGCSHVGIINILSSISERTKLPIYAVLGGTHLVEADENRLIQTIAALKQMGLQKIAVSHCTGQQGIDKMKSEFGEKFIINNTGHVFEV